MSVHIRLTNLPIFFGKIRVENVIFDSCEHI